MALEIGDKKLSNLRTHIAASFRDMADSATAMNAIAGPDGSVSISAGSEAAFEATLANFETTGRGFSTKFNALQTYCNGGSIPSELTDAPAQ